MNIPKSTSDSNQIVPTILSPACPSYHNGEVVGGVEEADDDHTKEGDDGPTDGHTHSAATWQSKQGTHTINISSKKVVFFLFTIISDFWVFFGVFFWSFPPLVLDALFRPSSNPRSSSIHSKHAQSPPFATCPLLTCDEHSADCDQSLESYPEHKDLESGEEEEVGQLLAKPRENERTHALKNGRENKDDTEPEEHVHHRLQTAPTRMRLTKMMRKLMTGEGGRWCGMVGFASLGCCSPGNHSVLEIILDESGGLVRKLVL